MLCDERDRLITAYTRRVDEWGNAVRRLRDDPTGDLEVRLPLLSAVEEAKVRAAHAKTTYEMHRKVHGC